jgi:putative Holliday junction resolvase
MPRLCWRQVYFLIVRRLGLDVGDARMGVAVSDETGMLARGLPTYGRVGPKKDVRAVAEIARAHEVEEIVVGLPLRLDGSKSPQTEKVLAFVEALRAAVKVPVTTWDERLTTVEAEQVLRGRGARAKELKASVDRVAAVLILQDYLDAHWAPSTA